MRIMVALGGFDENNEWKIYDPNDLPHSNLNSIEKDKGLWVKMVNSDNLEIEGIEFDNLQFSLKEGYNLISYPDLSERNLSFVFSNVISDIENIFTYENDVWKEYDPSKPSELNTLTTIKPGQGYWIKVNTNSVWQFNNHRFI